MLRDKGIYIVLGMHRSGTSLVAGLLHKGGISMGENFRKALPENPWGFFEEEAFRLFNDDILKDVGYAVKEWGTDFDGVKLNPTSISKATEIVNVFNEGYGKWGWKDPRTCLTIKIWLRALEKSGLLDMTNIIIVSRSISAVSTSLFRRGDSVNGKEGEKLYAMYHHQLNAGLLEYPKRLRILQINYEKLILGDDLYPLEEFCGVTVDRGFIDSSLNHADEISR